MDNDQQSYNIINPNILECNKVLGNVEDIKLLSLPDFISTDIIKYLYSNENSKELIELDLSACQTDKGIVRSPMLATEEFHLREITKNIESNNIAQILRHCIFFKESQVIFMRSDFDLDYDNKKNHDKIVKKTINKVVNGKLFSKRITPIEEKIMYYFSERDYNPKINHKDMERWMLQLRIDNLAIRTYSAIIDDAKKHNPSSSIKLGWINSHKDSLKFSEDDMLKLNELKGYFNERKSYGHASYISDIVADTTCSLGEKIKYYESYKEHFRRDYAMQMIFEIIMMSKFAKKDDIATRWIDYYAKNQKNLDGVFKNTFKGFKWVAGKTAVYDPKKSWNSEYIIVEPLISKILIDLKSYDSLSENKKIDLAKEVLLKCDFNREQYTQYIRDYFGMMKDKVHCRYEIDKMQRFMKQAGVVITDSLEIK